MVGEAGAAEVCTSELERLREREGGARVAEVPVELRESGCIGGGAH